MKGAKSHELDVALPAGELWGIYGTLRLAELAVELLPDVIAKTVVEEGDGGTGSLVRVVYPAGSPGPSYHTEKFVKIDDEQMLKEVVVVEGGMLDLGFRSFLFRFEVIEKTGSSCTVKSSIEYELDEEHAANEAYATTDALAAIVEAVSKHLLEKKTGA
ncbi:S-norcoclaurine synthase 2-like [Iris pallida]|uniref:S-norcoclaurine synthase 2-like n=1 Tax=Iris pallida TaxID=29817 RepID=A0AAX6FPZ2_IRIPA|nr:S-norcoclaurine synthase 2-like [Iris pallida]